MKEWSLYSDVSKKTQSPWLSWTAPLPAEQAEGLISTTRLHSIGINSHQTALSLPSSHWLAFKEVPAFLRQKKIFFAPNKEQSPFLKTLLSSNISVESFNTGEFCVTVCSRWFCSQSGHKAKFKAKRERELNWWHDFSLQWHGTVSFLCPFVGCVRSHIIYTYLGGIYKCISERWEFPMDEVMETWLGNSNRHAHNVQKSSSRNRDLALNWSFH